MRWLLTFFVALGIAFSPALAHKGEKHGGDEVAQHEAAAAQTSPAPESSAHAGPITTVEPERQGAITRTADWLGRLHPALVHFPLALLPLALLAALLAKRHSHLEPTARFLIIAAGITGPVAAALGWLGAVPSWWDADSLVAWHRWLGTALGLLLGILGWLAWRRPKIVMSRSVHAGLAILTIALLAQGWLGGSMIHGMDHLDW